jgi:hypothetical protein
MRPCSDRWHHGRLFAILCTPPADGLSQAGRDLLTEGFAASYCELDTLDAHYIISREAHAAVHGRRVVFRSLDNSSQILVKRLQYEQSGNGTCYRSCSRSQDFRPVFRWHGKQVLWGRVG